MRDDAIEHRLGIEPSRADGVEHVGHRSLACQRLVQIIEQLGVADGDRRLFRERVQDAGFPLVERPYLATIHPQSPIQLSIDAQYAVYLDRQKADVDAVRRDESREIPDWVDYALIPGLSAELRQKLLLRRPSTIAQAQGIEGMTAAAITLLLSVIRRGSLRKAG